MMLLGSVADSDVDRLQTIPSKVGGMVTQSVYIVLEDVDRHCGSARAAGATIVFEPSDEDHGGRSYSCKDPEGRLWNFGSYDPWD